jgi:pentatricopeptide repeat protein
MMKKADIIYNEDNLLKILNGLEARGNWRQALSVTEWVYNENEKVMLKAKKYDFVLKFFEKMRKMGCLQGQ